MLRSGEVAAATISDECVQLRINGLGGAICELDACRSWTVGHVKAAIEFEADIEKGEQRLFAGVTELRDSEELRSLPSGHFAELTLVRVLRSPEQVAWLCRVELDGMELRHAAAGIRSDYEVVLAAVSENGLALEFAHPELQADFEIVHAAVRKDVAALKFASSELQAHGQLRRLAGAKREEWLRVVECNGSRLREAPAGIRSDPSVVLAAVSKSGRALQFAGDCLKADRSVVLAAVRADGRALKYAAKHLQADAEIALAAVQNNGYALEFIAEEVHADAAVVLAAVCQNGEALAYAADALRADPQIIRAAVRQTGHALAHVAVGLDSQLHRAVVLDAVRQNKAAVRFAPCHLKTDPEVLRAVRGSGADLRTSPFHPGLAAQQLPEESRPCAISQLIRRALPDWSDDRVRGCLTAFRTCGITDVGNLRVALQADQEGAMEINEQLYRMGVARLDEGSLRALQRQCALGSP